MTELKQLRDFAEQLNGIRPQERSLKGVVNNLIQNYNPEIVANPELDGTELFLRGLQMGNAKYSVNDDNKISLSVVPFFDTNNKIKTLIFVITIKDYISNYSGNQPNLESVVLYIKDENEGTLTTHSITTMSKQIKINNIYYYKKRGDGDNVRYAYYMLSNLNEVQYSKHILSACGTVEYKYMDNENEILKYYGTNVCYCELSEIAEEENNSKGLTKGESVESTPIQEIDSVDLDNDEK